MKKLSTTKLLSLMALVIGMGQAVAATFNVTSLSGGIGDVGSFAWAVAEANYGAQPAPHLIEFSGTPLNDNTLIITDQVQIRRQIMLDGSTHPSGSVTLDADGANIVMVNFFNVGGLDPAGSVLRNFNLVNSIANGVQIEGCDNITVQGCRIGVESDGLTANLVSNGIFLFGNSTNCTIGGTAAGEPNQVAGCRDNGILLIGAGTRGNTISGNYLGVDISGNAALGNGSNGVHLDEAPGNFIGPDNIISANASNGIFLINAPQNKIFGNYMGTGEDGITPLGNGSNGIDAQTSDELVIGGVGLQNRNVISGNASNGVRIFNSTGVQVLGNFIGTDVTGSVSIPNFQGVNVTGGSATENTIGSTEFMGRNVVSGNQWHGIFFEDNAVNNEVFGNYIGTDSTGLLPVGNGRNGVSGTDALTTLVGGTTIAERNVISGNGFNEMRPESEGPWFSGVSFQDSDGLTVKGNYIGIGADGETAIPNANYGIWNINSTNLTVGGTLEAERNIISGNGSVALAPEANQLVSPYEKSSRGIYTYNVSAIKVINNFIGTNAAGTSAVPNLADGLAFIESSSIVLGGAGDSTNVISGNNYVGAHIFQSTDVRVQNNYFGLSADGSSALANGQDGLYLNDQDGVAVEGNVFSGNGQTGLHIFGGNNNQITNNLVGLRADGVTAQGNVMGGIRLANANGNTLTQNQVAYSTGVSSNSLVGDGYGIYVGGASANQNLIDQNLVYCNAELNISLAQDGTSFGTAGAGNDDKETPTISPAISGSSVTNGTGIPGDEIQVFTNEPGCGCGGKEYLGSTTVQPDSTWSFDHPGSAVLAGDSNLVAVTATDAQNNTSQFICKSALAGAPDLAIATSCESEAVDITLTDHRAAMLVWQVATDENFTNIVWEDSTDAVANPYEYSYAPNESGTLFVRVISVVDEGNFAISASENFSVISAPATGDLLKDTTICAGSEMTVELEAASGTPSWFSSTDGVAWTPLTDESGLSLTESPLEDTWFTALLTSDIGGCEAATDTILVEVNALITGTVAIELDSNDVCQGFSQTFTALTRNAGSGASYEWFVNGQSVGNDSDVFTSSNLSQGDEVSVELTLDTLCPAQAVVPSDELTVVIQDTVNPVVAIEGDKGICDGQLASFEVDSMAHAGDIPVVTWWVNDILQETGFSFSSTELSDGDEVYAMLNSNARCLRDSTALSNSIFMQNAAALEPEITISGDALGVCPGESITFTSEVQHGGTNPLIVWFRNGIAVATTPTILLTNYADGDSIWASMTSDLQCVIKAGDTSEVSEITLLDALNPSVTLDFDTNGVCAGDAITLTALPEESGISPTFQWEVNGSLVGGNTDELQLTSLEDGDQVFVSIVLDEALCASSYNETSVPFVAEIISPLDPTVTLGQDLSIICEDATVTFDTLGTTHLENPNFTMYLNGDFVSTVPPFTSSILEDGDIVKIIATTDKSCVSATEVADSIIVSIQPLEDLFVSITPSVNDACVPEGQDITFDLSTNVDPTATTSYQWFVNGAELPTETAPSYTLVDAEDGDFVRVSLTTDQECVAQSTVNSSIETVDISHPLEANAGQDQYLTASGVLSFEGEVTGAPTNLVWIKIVEEDTTVLSLTSLTGEEEVSAAENEFMLIATNEHCADSSSFTAFINFDIHIPNVYSPNGDNNHDKWMITNIENFPDVDIEIYNRWGSVVFEVDKGEGYTFENAWDGTFEGTNLPDATYYYVLKIDDEAEPFSGSVTIIR